MIEVDSPLIKDSVAVLEKKINTLINKDYMLNHVKYLAKIRNLLLEPYLRMQAPALKLVQEPVLKFVPEDQPK